MAGQGLRLFVRELLLHRMMAAGKTLNLMSKYNCCVYFESKKL